MDPLSYFGLTQEPFSNAPVSRFYFDSAQSRAALVRLQRAVGQMKGLAVVVGEIGAGKTTLARKLLDSLPESEYEAALLVIIHSGVSSDWLLKRIAQQLGVQDPSTDKLQLLSQLYKRLLEISEIGKKAVVLIDEAQMLHSREIMEELRGILNLELTEKKLITFVLFGLADVEACLSLDPPLAQRVAVKYKLHPLDAEATKEYVEHRMKLAGSASCVFDHSAIDALFVYSKGSPRLINTLADNALFEATLTQQKIISSEIISRVGQDLGLEGEVTPIETLVAPSDGLNSIFEQEDSLVGFSQTFDNHGLENSLPSFAISASADADMVEEDDFLRKDEAELDDTDFLLNNLEDLSDEDIS